MSAVEAGGDTEENHNHFEGDGHPGHRPKIEQKDSAERRNEMNPDNHEHKAGSNAPGHKS